MSGASLVKRTHELATDLTGSFVYNTSVNIGSNDFHDLVITYDPDEADGRLHVIIEITDDDNNTTDANAEWTQVGTIANASGTLTFTASELQVDSTGAGTKLYVHWSENTVMAYRMRIGVRETFTGAGSDFGNVRITQFSRNS